MAMVDDFFGLVGGNADQQAAGGLGVVKEFETDGIEVALLGQALGDIGRVGAAGASEVRLPGERFRARQQGQPGQMDDQRGLAALGHAVGMAGQAKSGDVGGRVGAGGNHGVAAHVVEHGHAGDRGVKEFLAARACLVGRGGETGPQRLGEDQLIAGPGGGVGEDLLGMDDAGDRVTKLDLAIAHRVPADDDGAGLLKAVDASLKHFFKPRQFRVLVVGITQEVQAGERLAAHGVDIAQGVGGRDLTIQKWIIDHWRKKVDGLDQGDLVREAIDPRVVVRFGTDEEVWIGELG